MHNKSSQEINNQHFTKADLHIHSNYSFDCNSSLKSIFAEAKKTGINVIALTDHDSIDGIKQAKKLATKYQIELIPGIEVTAKGGTHIIGLFIDKKPSGHDILEIIAQIKKEGGLVILPHPYRSDTGLFYNWKVKNLYTQSEVEKIVQSVDAIEIINYKSVIKSESLDLDILTKYSKPFISGSDSHFPFEIGHAYLQIPVKPNKISKENILNPQNQIYFHNNSAPKIMLKKPQNTIEENKLRAKINQFLPVSIKKIIEKIIINQAHNAEYKKQKNKTIKLLSQNNFCRLIIKNDLPIIEKVNL